MPCPHPNPGAAAEGLCQTGAIFDLPRIRSVATQRFLVFMGVSLLLFGAVLLWVLRRRPERPAILTTAWVSLVVVVGGMVFARYAANLGVTPIVYYGAPALITLLLPPIVFRMRASEVVQYLILAFLSSPLIHILFSLALAWHEYLPFWYVPSLGELLRGRA
jgi:hypothetical protein